MESIETNNTFYSTFLKALKEKDWKSRGIAASLALEQVSISVPGHQLAQRPLGVAVETWPA